MKTILPTVFALTGIGAVLAAGVCHGIWTERWSSGGDRSQLPLSSLPSVLGDWRGDPPTEKDEKGLTFYSRLYVNTVTGQSVLVAITHGKPGPVSVHTPDVCYEGNGFEITKPTRMTPTLKGSEQLPQFFTSQFKKESPTGPRYLRIFWSWTTGDDWLAPDKPRLVFARYPRLLKLYLISEQAGEKASTEGDPSLDFMPLFLPEVQKLLAG